MSTIELKDIDTTIAYEGYLCMSNADRAVEYHYDRPLDAALLDSVNPFVKEGYLYSREEGISISIKYIDGRYLVSKHRVDESDYEDPEVESLQLVALRMSRPHLKFLRYWREEKDLACLGMGVLVFDHIAFVGFED